MPTCKFCILRLLGVPSPCVPKRLLIADVRPNASLLRRISWSIGLLHMKILYIRSPLTKYQGSPISHTATRSTLRGLEDSGWGSASEAAGRVEGVNAEELVDEAAGDAKHGGTAVLALSIELEGLGLRVIIAHPAVAANVSRRLLADVRVALILEEEIARLHHASGQHDLQPARGRKCLERRKAARRDIRELEALGRREVAGEACAGLDEKNMDKAKHGRTAVLDLHNLEAGHVAGLDEAERVVHAERGEDTNVTLGEHLRGRAARLGRERRLEGRDGLKERKGSDGL